MRRAIYAILFAAAAIAALVVYQRATETIVVERPALNGPPPNFVRRAIPNLVGRAMPPIATVDPATLRNRVVVVSIWATWCAPCRAELPRIAKEIWEPHRNDVAVVAISAESPSIVSAYNRVAHFPFTVIADPTRRLPRLFGLDAPIPRTFVIDRGGVIRYQHIGYSPRSFGELVAVVERLSRQQAL